MSTRNVVHVEIPASDVNSSAKFYRDLFDWKIVPMPEIDYTMWEAGDGSGGGFPRWYNEKCVKRRESWYPCR
jgi:predicted enzyme related to lactoylglutathione lyase